MSLFTEEQRKELAIAMTMCNFKSSLIAYIEAVYGSVFVNGVDELFTKFINTIDAEVHAASSREIERQLREAEEGN